MDLLVKLPTTDSLPSFYSILFIVDKLTKLVRLIPCREAMTAMDTAAITYTHWISHYGLPEQIISDRGPHFNNVFTADVHWSYLGVKQSLSSAYHPQTDGHTERANRVIEDMLRHYVSPSQTDLYLY
jgi:transposase InsO family protein